MKRLLIVFIQLMLCSVAFPQKKIIEITDLGTWPNINSKQISNNGQYIWYSVYNPKDTACPSTFTVVDVVRNRHRSFELYDKLEITEDSRFLVCSKKDSFIIFDLDRFSIVSSFFAKRLLCYNSRGNTFWIYVTDDGTLCIENTKGKVLYKMANVKSEKMTENGTLFLLDSEYNLFSYDLLSFRRSWWTKAHLSLDKFDYDYKNGQVTFLTEGSLEDGDALSVMTRLGRINRIIDTILINDGRKVAQIRFSKDGRSIILYLESSASNKFIAPSVDVNSYKDQYLQAFQQASMNDRRNLSSKYVFSLRSNKWNQIFKENDVSKKMSREIGATDRFTLIQSDRNEVNDSAFDFHHFNAGRKALLLVNNETGDSIKVVDNIHLLQPQFSPNGQYVLYFDQSMQTLCSFNIKTQQTNVLTSKIPFSVLTNDLNLPYKSTLSSNGVTTGIEGFLSDGTSVCISDGLDLWKIDISNDQLPVNITNGYGRRNGILFKLLDIQESIKRKRAISSSDIYVKGININNKEEGFFKLTPKFKDPVLLSCASVLTTSIVGAKSSNAFLFKRESCSTFPNLYYTRDFTHFKQITYLHPESEYSWYTSKIINYRLPDSTIAQGVLYYGQDIDSSLKHPLIFQIYERFTNLLNEYKLPEASNGMLNIPYLVSHGYIVFQPDFKYKIGCPGGSAYKNVAAAINVLKNMCIVDSMRLGLNGVSFGGYETNYIVTKTTSFRAAVSCYGLTDFISGYGSLWVNRNSQFLYESQQNRLGKTLWQDPESYILNSPVFYIDKIMTPILIMHNKLDYNVPFSQGLEFFLGLRRLGKPSWLLQYDEQGHGVSGKAAIDFTIRSKQFLDYYLKDSVPPVWMTQGIPIYNKSFGSGFGKDSLNIP